jgi:fluoroacetyl-CoA thioesterase
VRPAELGAEAAMTVTVTAALTARFDDEAVHPVYGTAALVRHVEQVSRRLLLPLLEDEEEGVGAELTVRQIAPVRVGEMVELTARVTAAAARTLTTAVAARHDGEIVAEATFTQAVVHLPTWRARAGLTP